VDSCRPRDAKARVITTDGDSSYIHNYGSKYALQHGYPHPYAVPNSHLLNIVGFTLALVRAGDYGEQYHEMSRAKSCEFHMYLDNCSKERAYKQAKSAGGS